MWDFCTLVSELFRSEHTGLFPLSTISFQGKELKLCGNVMGSGDLNAWNLCKKQTTQQTQVSVLFWLIRNKKMTMRMKAHSMVHRALFQPSLWFASYSLFCAWAFGHVSTLPKRVVFNYSFVQTFKLHNKVWIMFVKHGTGRQFGSSGCCTRWPRGRFSCFQYSFKRIYLKADGDDLLEKGREKIM